MAEDTAIAWTDHTFNPWWGCTKVDAPGDEPSECDNCYAETGSIRYGWSDDGASGPALWGKGSERRRLSDKNWNLPLKWDREAAAAGVTDLVFCGSYCDVFEGRDDLDPERARLWELIEATPNLVWQLLTKRPEQVPHRVPAAWMGPHPWRTDRTGWPPNVWIGTSVGTQRSAKLRIPRLLEIPAPVRFLSCEPLLGEVDLSPWLLRPWHGEVPGSALNDGCPMDGAVEAVRDAIHWVIAGGESGPGHRPMDMAWANKLRWDCHDGRIPFFFKQVGGSTPTAGGHLIDGRVHQAFPAGMEHRHDVAVTAKGTIRS